MHGGELTATLSRQSYKEIVMRKLSLTLLATTAVIGLAASVAAAADLPRKAPPAALPPPPPPYNWSGFYVGAFGGGGWVRNDVTSSITTGRLDTITTFPDAGLERISSGLGPLGGVTVGWNWQLPTAPIVLGIEGDFAWADLKGSADRSATVFKSVDTLFNASLHTGFKVKDIATITGRLGLISGPQDRTMIYLKGGGAWTRTDVALAAQLQRVDFATDTIENVSGAFSDKFDKWGWTVGAGLEFGLWDNWTGKVEYDYLNFGTRNFSLFIDDPLLNNDIRNTTVTASVKEQIHKVVIGLNYRFNWWR